MQNYKQLFYQSQAALADAIKNLEKLTQELKECMQACEETVITEDENSQSCNETI